MAPRLPAISSAREAPLDPSFTIRDLGPAEDTSRLAAEAWRGEERVCRLEYASWPGYLLLFEVDGPYGAEVMAALLARLPEPPARVTHYNVGDQATLRWYQDGPLASGVVLAGYYGPRGLSYDPIGCVDLSAPPGPFMEGQPPICVVVLYDAAMRTFGEVRDPTPDHAWRWLHDPDANSRIAAIRRFVLDRKIAPDVARLAHHLAMLNEHAGVRQFAAIQLSGYTNDPHLVADVRALHALMVEPWGIARAFGQRPPEIPAASLAQSRRNARYAVAWTLGNLAQTALAPAAAAWVKAAVGTTGELLQEAAARFDAARDRRLYALALAELGDHPVERFAFGADEPLDLLDFLRFAALRWGLVCALGLKAQDRFYWLVDTGAAILRGREGEAAARIVAAPPPEERRPEVERLPEWIYGENHYAGSAGDTTQGGPGV